jgi:hypothetical protein
MEWRTVFGENRLWAREHVIRRWCERIIQVLLSRKMSE